VVRIGGNSGIGGSLPGASGRQSAGPVPYRTPKEAVKALLRAIRTGDGEAYANCLDATPEERPTMVALGKAVKKTMDFEAAMIAAYGLAAWEAVGGAPAQSRAVPAEAEVDRWTIQVQGDAAIANVPGRTVPIRFVRKRGGWLVAPGGMFPRDKDTIRRTMARSRAAAARIRFVGKHIATVGELESLFRESLRKFAGPPKPPAATPGKPAPKPAPKPAVGAEANRPRPPLTGRNSIQLFMGKTQNCMIAIWPPASYADGKSIPYGTKVQLRVYRSYDGGKTYGRTGVQIVGGGQGFAGQGTKDPRKKRWIDAKLKTPVDNKKPYAVWLAVSAVVGGQESALVNRYMTFTYASKGGMPRLVVHETPDIGDGGVDDRTARPLPQELPGKWTDCEWTPREAHPATAIFSKTLNQPHRMTLEITEIDLVRAPGLRGVPVSPHGLRKVKFPGNLLMSVVFPGGKPKRPKKIGFVYDYRERSIRFEEREASGTTGDYFFTRHAGHFFQTPTHYVVRGTWKLSYLANGKEAYSIKGTWSAKKRKP
jgi:hypothetical protein